MRILACCCYINLCCYLVTPVYAGVNFSMTSEPKLVTMVREFDDFIRNEPFLDEEKNMEWEQKFKAECAGNEVLEDKIFQKVVIVIMWLEKRRGDLCLLELQNLKNNLKELQQVGAGVKIQSYVIKKEKVK